MLALASLLLCGCVSVVCVACCNPLPCIPSPLNEMKNSAAIFGHKITIFILSHRDENFVSFREQSAHGSYIKILFCTEFIKNLNRNGKKIQIKNILAFSLES